MAAMTVSAPTRQLCGSTFADDDVPEALAVLALYDGPERERVHRALVRLSGGRLDRLRDWLEEAKRRPETVLWFGEEPTDVSPETHAFGVEWINAFIDKHLDAPPQQPA
ncbi:hypothetical protein ACFY3O_04500 [Streptomyces sp. NPDC001046]|uniref:hypothetical protein n=1 Tax=Streptomyces sp. NPDC001046 TaxID=3364543 RepID=UPI0036934956